MGRKITDLFLAAAGMLGIISAAVILTLAFRPLYRWEIRNLNLAQTYGYTEEEILENYDELIDYNLSPFHKELKFPTFPMSREAEIHFVEVKRIFQGFLIIGIFCVVITLAAVVARAKKKDLGYLRTAGMLSLILPAVTGCLAALNWEKFFVAFHELAFDNDYWIFDPAEDPIINCLPDEFFFHCVVMILLIVVLLSILCIVTGSRWKGGEGEISDQ